MKQQNPPGTAQAPATLVISVSKRDLWRAVSVLGAAVVLAAAGFAWSSVAGAADKCRAMEAAAAQVHQESARLLAKAGTILQWSDGELAAVDAAAQAQRKAARSSAIDPEPLQVRLGSVGSELDQARQAIDQTRQLWTTFSMQAAMSGWTQVQDPVSADRLSELGGQMDRVGMKFQNTRMAVDQLDAWRGTLARREADDAAAAARQRAAVLAAQQRQPQVIRQVVYDNTPSISVGFGYYSGWGWGWPGYYSSCYPRYYNNDCYPPVRGPGRPGVSPGRPGGGGGPVVRNPPRLQTPARYVAAQLPRGNSPGGPGAGFGVKRR